MAETEGVNGSADVLTETTPAEGLSDHGTTTLPADEPDTISEAEYAALEDQCEALAKMLHAERSRLHDMKLLLAAIASVSPPEGLFIPRNAITCCDPKRTLVTTDFERNVTLHYAPAREAGAPPKPA